METNPASVPEKSDRFRSIEGFDVVCVYSRQYIAERVRFFSKTDQQQLRDVCVNGTYTGKTTAPSGVVFDSSVQVTSNSYHQQSVLLTIRNDRFFAFEGLAPNLHFSISVRLTRHPHLWADEFSVILSKKILPKSSSQYGSSYWYYAVTNLHNGTELRYGANQPSLSIPCTIRPFTEQISTLAVSEDGVQVTATHLLFNMVLNVHETTYGNSLSLIRERTYADDFFHALLHQPHRELPVSGALVPLIQPLPIFPELQIDRSKGMENAITHIHDVRYTDQPGEKSAGGYFFTCKNRKAPQTAPANPDRFLGAGAECTMVISQRMILEFLCGYLEQYLNMQFTEISPDLRQFSFVVHNEIPFKPGKSVLLSKYMATGQTTLTGTMFVDFETCFVRITCALPTVEKESQMAFQVSYFLQRNVLRFSFKLLSKPPQHQNNLQFYKDFTDGLKTLFAPSEQRPESLSESQERAEKQPAGIFLGDAIIPDKPFFNNGNLCINFTIDDFN